MKSWGMRGMGYEEVIRNAHRILVRKSEGKRPLEGIRYRWEDNTRMDPKQKGWVGV
jgi:hypothetical protein